MKLNKFSLPLIAVIAIWAAGCGKEEGKTITEQTKDAASATGDDAKQAVEAVKDTGAKVVSDATEKVKEITAPASGKVQEVIDAAKNLVGDGKYQDALTKLKDISGEKLSAGQQTIVDGLKAQIAKALGTTTSDAAGAAGNLLKK